MVPLNRQKTKNSRKDGFFSAGSQKNPKKIKSNKKVYCTSLKLFRAVITQNLERVLERFLSPYQSRQGITWKFQVTYLLLEEHCSCSQKSTPVVFPLCPCCRSFLLLSFNPTSVLFLSKETQSWCKTSGYVHLLYCPFLEKEKNHYYFYS